MDYFASRHRHWPGPPGPTCRPESGQSSSMDPLREEEEEVPRQRGDVHNAKYSLKLAIAGLYTDTDRYVMIAYLFQFQRAPRGRLCGEVGLVTTASHIA